jgi:hypothetical protein
MKPIRFLWKLIFQPFLMGCATGALLLLVAVLVVELCVAIVDI